MGKTMHDSGKDDDDQWGYSIPSSSSVWILISAFILQLLYSSKDSLSGVFLVEFSHNHGHGEMFVTTVASCHTGMAYIGALPCGIIIKRFGIPLTVFFGVILIAVGFASSAFVPSFEYLLFTYGILSGLGLSFFFTSAVFVIQHHFDDHRAFAQGLSSAGQSVGQFLWPPLTQWLFHHYGWRGAFLIIAGVHLQGCVVAMLLRIYTMKCDKPVAGNEDDRDNHKEKQMASDKIFCIHKNEFRPKTKTNKPTKEVSAIQHMVNHAQQKITFSCRFAKSKLFDRKNSPKIEMKSGVHGTWESLLQVLNNSLFISFCVSFFLLFGGMIPYLWLPSLGVRAGASAQASAFLVSVNAVSNGICRILWGAVSDFPHIKKYRSILISISMILSALLCTALVVMTTYNLLIVYAVIQGMISSYYFSLSFTVCADIIGKDNIAVGNPLVILSYGISSFISSPFAGWLVTISGGTSVMVVVCGSIQLIGGVQLLVVDIINRYKQAKQSYNIGG